MRITKSLVLLSASLLLGGCYRPTEKAEVQDLRGTASASAGSDGTVTSRAPTQEELKILEAHSAKGEAVNKRFPPVAIPMNSPVVKAARMLKTGEVALSDGRTILLDGVSCSDEGIVYLGRFLVGPNIELIVVENGPPVEGKTPADVWTVEKLESGMKSYGFPVESGLTSGWCHPTPSPTSKHNERFAALAEAFSGEQAMPSRSAP